MLDLIEFSNWQAVIDVSTYIHVTPKRLPNNTYLVNYIVEV